MATIPVRRFLVQAALGCVALLAFWVPASSASLNVFYSDVGALTLSVDGIGTNDVSGVVQAEKPPGATVSKAFLFAASTGFTGFVPPDGEVTIDDQGVSWNPADTIANGISSYNVAADVTDLVKPKIDAASAGRVDFTISELDTTSMDGEILAVVFSDPAAKTSTIVLMYGAQTTTGDHFSIGLQTALKPSDRATMGLGISYGFQPSGQYSQVDVDGARLTSAAGGQDDGDVDNGELLTVGGLDDSPDDPADPFAHDACGSDPRCDDELYDLKPFVAAGDGSIGVDTLNPSNDDNILFASFSLSTAAVVGQGILLSPTGTTSQLGAPHAVTALVQDGDGKPEVGRNVTLRVTAGPSAGTTLTGTTDNTGRATFSYPAPSATGTDAIEASFVDDVSTLHTSNDATQQWVARVAGTFGGQWPYFGNSLELYYTYGGDHRYLGNVVQGAANWSHSGTNVHVDAWPGVPYAVHIPIIDVDLQDNWWGLTLFADGGCLTCGFTRNSIMLNQRTLDPEADDQRTKVATHEMGHAIGLEHPDPSSAGSAPSVMWQGELGGKVRVTPQTFDTSRVNAMYP